MNELLLNRISLLKKKKDKEKKHNLKNGVGLISAMQVSRTMRKTDVKPTFIITD